MCDQETEKKINPNSFKTMETTELIKEINLLSLEKRFFIIEQTLKSIQKQDSSNQTKRAVEALYADYAENGELTAFTNLDFDNFYEAK